MRFLLILIALFIPGFQHLATGDERQLISKKSYLRQPWAVCFIFTFCVFVLQVFPPIGIFLMLVMAPFWSVVSINLGFVLLAVAGMRGQVPRLTLALPFLWFGGYLAVAAYSHWSISVLETDILRQNQSSQISFDPKSNDIVVLSDTALSGLPRDYDLDQLFMAPKRRCAAFMKTTVSPGTCQGRGDVVNGCTIMATPWTSKSGQKICWQQAPGTPSLPRITISEQAEDFDSLLYKGTIRHFLFDKEGAGQSTITTGQLAPLSWIPLPVLG